jgi:hypothetical protein
LKSFNESGLFELGSHCGLDTDEDIRESVVSNIFKNTEETGLEEDFGVSESVFVVVDIDGAQKFFGSFLVVQKLSFWDNIRVQDSVSLFEISVRKPVWVTFSANSDSFEDTVTSELMENQMWIGLTWFLVLVWYNAPDEMWVSGLQVGHESTEGFSMKSGDSHETGTLLLLFLSTGSLSFFVSLNLFFQGHVISPNLLHEHEGGFFKKLDNGTVQWILVLLQPIDDVVTNATGVVVKFEVNISLSLGFSGGFTEGWSFTQMGKVEFLLVGLVGGFWEHTFFFESGHDTEWFFDKFNGSGQIHTEIDSLPVDTFFLVFFLFKDEHMMVEKLLKFLVGEVDAQLFECVETENFETGDI